MYFDFLESSKVIYFW